MHIMACIKIRNGVPYYEKRELPTSRSTHNNRTRKHGGLRKCSHFAISGHMYSFRVNIRMTYSMCENRLQAAVTGLLIVQNAGGGGGGHDTRVYYLVGGRSHIIMSTSYVGVYRMNIKLSGVMTTSATTCSEDGGVYSCFCMPYLLSY